MSSLTDKQRWCIRNVFLQRRESYGRKDAARRLGVPIASLDRERYSWADMVEIALRLWPMAAICDALGDDFNLPDGLRPEAIMLTLPAYQIAMLRQNATAASETVDESLARYLRTEARQMATYRWLAEWPREAALAVTPAVEPCALGRQSATKGRAARKRNASRGNTDPRIRKRRVTSTAH